MVASSTTECWYTVRIKLCEYAAAASMFIVSVIMVIKGLRPAVIISVHPASLMSDEYC